MKGRLKIYYCAGEDETTAFPGLSKSDFESDSVLVETFPKWKLLTDDEALITSSTHNNSANAGTFSVDVPADFYNKKLTLAIVRNPQKQLVEKNMKMQKVRRKQLFNQALIFKI